MKYIKSILIIGLSLGSFYGQAGVLATGFYSSDESQENVLIFMSHLAFTEDEDENKDPICQISLHKHKEFLPEFAELSPDEISFSETPDCIEEGLFIEMFSALSKLELFELEVQAASLPIRQAWLYLLGFFKNPSKSSTRIAYNIRQRI